MPPKPQVTTTINPIYGCSTSPAENPRFKRHGRRPPRRPITLLTVSEIESGTAKLPEYYALGLPLMAWCSFRFAELSELRVKDIEDGPRGMVIHVRRSAPLVNGKPKVKDGVKSDAGVRDVWVPSPLAEQIRNRLKVIDNSPNTFVVSNHRGDRLPRSTFTKQFKKVLPPAKAEMHVHALRHTGAVFAAWAGATTAELQERLGHATMEMAALYQHVAEGRQQAIAERMSDLH
ncbi:site-specific integrase [Gordonia sp. VNK1]|uniref:tyrosine-type recombinase/integrase n=1 Tax=Gordonia oleivorans TaxID=3156618 RepID=UPI0032B62046